MAYPVAARRHTGEAIDSVRISAGLSWPFGNGTIAVACIIIVTCGAGFALSVTRPLITPVFVVCAVGGAVDCADSVEAAAGSSSIKTNVTRYFIDLLKCHAARPKISTEPDLNRGALTDPHLVAAPPQAYLPSVIGY